MSSSPAPQQVTKFEAIRAQLDAAIELFFTSDNVVATHTLAAAAYNALKDIAKHEGAERPFLKSEYLESLPESERERIAKFLNEPENFFKHANRDPTGTISFNPGLTEVLLADACAYFVTSPEPRPRYYDIFKVWVGKTKEDVPHNSPLRVLVDDLRVGLKGQGKNKFWQIMREHLGTHHG